MKLSSAFLVQKEKGGTYVALHKLCQVYVPNFERNGESEQLDTTFINLETLFEVFVLLEESRVVYDDLSICDT